MIRGLTQADAKTADEIWGDTNGQKKLGSEVQTEPVGALPAQIIDPFRAPAKLKRGISQNVPSPGKELRSFVQGMVIVLNKILVKPPLALKPDIAPVPEKAEARTCVAAAPVVPFPAIGIQIEAVKIFQVDLSYGQVIAVGGDIAIGLPGRRARMAMGRQHAPPILGDLQIGSCENLSGRSL